MRDLNNSEMSSFNHVSPPTSTIYTLKNSEVKGKEVELKPRHSESTNYDVIGSGVIIASPDSDVTVREREIKRPVARKRFPRKHSFRSNLRCSKSLLRVYSQTFTLIALILSIILSIVGGLFNVKLPERKSTVGNSFEPRRFRASSVLYSLREFLANGSRKSNSMVSPLYSSLSMLLSIMRVHGNLTPWYHQYTALSPYAVEHHAGSRKSNSMVSPV